MPGPHPPLSGLASLLQPFGRQGRRHGRSGSGPAVVQGGQEPHDRAGPVARPAAAEGAHAAASSPAQTPPPAPVPGGQQPEDYFSFRPAPTPVDGAPPPGPPASPLSPPAPLVASPPPLPTPSFAPPPPYGPVPPDGAAPPRPPRPPTPLAPTLTPVAASSVGETAGAGAGAAKVSASRFLLGSAPRQGSRRLQWDRRPLSLLGLASSPPRPAPPPPPKPDELGLVVAQVRSVAGRPLRPRPADQVLEEAQLMDLLGVRAYVLRLVESASSRASFRSLLGGLDEVLRAIALGLRAAGLGTQGPGPGEPEAQLAALAEARYAAWCSLEPDAPSDADARADLLLHASLNVALRCRGSTPDEACARAIHEAVATAGIASYQLLLRLRSVVREGVEPLRQLRPGAEPALIRPLHRLASELGDTVARLRAQHERVAGLRHELQRQLGGDPLLHQPLQTTRTLWLPCPVVAGRQHRVADSLAAFRLATLYEVLIDVSEGCLAEVQRAADALREAKARLGRPTLAARQADGTEAERLPALVAPVPRPRSRYVPPPAEGRYGPPQPRVLRRTQSLGGVDGAPAR